MKLFSKIAITGVLGALLAAPIAFAAPPGARGRLFSESKGGLKTPILFNLAEEKETLAQRAKAPDVSQISGLLPDRVYLYFFPPEKRWMFILTDGNGDFRHEPMEFLRSTSTLPGVKLGAKDPDQRYQLGDDGRWKLTFKKEFYAFWVYSTPPRIKFIEFGAL